MLEIEWTIDGQKRLETIAVDDTEKADGQIRLNLSKKAYDGFIEGSISPLALMNTHCDQVDPKPHDSSFFRALFKHFHKVKGSWPISAQGIEQINRLSKDTDQIAGFDNVDKTPDLAQAHVQSGMPFSFSMSDFLIGETDVEAFCRDNNDMSFPVHVQNAPAEKKGNVGSITAANATYQSMTPEEFREFQKAGEEDGSSSYLAGAEAPESLRAKIQTPHLFDDFSFLAPKMWMGFKPTKMQCHQDLVDNFLLQLDGEKTVHLSHPSRFSDDQIITTFSNPYYRYTLEKLGASGGDLEIVLKAGDAVYIPAGWWHQTATDGLSFSVNSFAARSTPMVLR